MGPDAGSSGRFHDSGTEVAVIEAAGSSVMCGDCTFCTAPMLRLPLPASHRGLPSTSAVMHEPSIGLSSAFAPPGHAPSSTESTSTPGYPLSPGSV